VDTTISLRPAPNYAREPVEFHQTPESISINGRYWLYASHSLTVEEESVSFTLPRGETGLLHRAEARLLQQKICIQRQQVGIVGIVLQRLRNQVFRVLAPELQGDFRQYGSCPGVVAPSALRSMAACSLAKLCSACPLRTATLAWQVAAAREG
jgi:hypothetical protein